MSDASITPPKATPDKSKTQSSPRYVRDPRSLADFGESEGLFVVYPANERKFIEMVEKGDDVVKSYYLYEAKTKKMKKMEYAKRVLAWKKRVTGKLVRKSPASKDAGSDVKVAKKRVIDQLEMAIPKKEDQKAKKRKEAIIDFRATSESTKSLVFTSKEPEVSDKKPPSKVKVESAKKPAVIRPVIDYGVYSTYQGEKPSELRDHVAGKLSSLKELNESTTIVYQVLRFYCKYGNNIDDASNIAKEEEKTRLGDWLSSCKDLGLKSAHGDSADVLVPSQVALAFLPAFLLVSLLEYGNFKDADGLFLAFKFPVFCGSPISNVKGYKKYWENTALDYIRDTNFVIDKVGGSTPEKKKSNRKDAEKQIRHWNNLANEYLRSDIKSNNVISKTLETVSSQKYPSGTIAYDWIHDILEPFWTVDSDGDDSSDFLL